MQKLFLKQLFIGHESEKQNLSFQTDFYCNFKTKEFLFTTSVSVLHLQSACARGSKGMKKMIWESEEKNKFLCRFRVGPYTKRLWPRS